MLKHEDNELLVRVGPGTPMGQYLRRFWTPALLSEEIFAPDCPPVRVKLMGEELVAFRDTNGKIGLVDAYCPHRRAELFWGRNEDCGLRCVYHGWKFDTEGRCVDLPNAPDGDRIRKNMKITSYPTVERSGIIWAYLGPRDLMPEFPAAEVFNLPATHRYIQKMIIPTNWLQSMEGDVDSSHVSFLHRGAGPVPLSKFIFDDTAPRYNVVSMNYGLLLAAQRDAGPDHYHWRFSQWLVPNATLVASPSNRPFITNIRIPIDDVNTMHIRIYSRIDAELTNQDWDLVHSGKLFPAMKPGTYFTQGNAGNDYLIDRRDQKENSFTGIESIPLQDYAVTANQGGGPILDRSRERPTASDTAIIAVRKRLLSGVKDLLNGKEPSEPASALEYRVRPADVLMPRSVDINTNAQILVQGPESIEAYMRAS